MNTRYIVQIAKDKSPTQTMGKNNKIAVDSTDTQMNKEYNGELKPEAIKDFLLSNLKEDNFREKRQRLENAKYICLILDVGIHKNDQLHVCEEKGRKLTEIAHIEEIDNECSLKQMNRLYVSDRIPKKIRFENENEQIKETFIPNSENVFDVKRQ